MSDAHFPRRSRLVTKADYGRVFAKPTKSGDAFFGILARPNDLDYARLGLAISRKIAKQAVLRNRVKRIIRESFRHHQAVLQGLDIIVMGRSKLVHADNPELFDALHNLWHKLPGRCGLDQATQRLSSKP